MTLASTPISVGVVNPMSAGHLRRSAGLPSATVGSGGADGVSFSTEEEEEKESDEETEEAGRKR